jgi:curved DNA-binding protein CbpA
MRGEPESPAISAQPGSPIVLWTAPDLYAVLGVPRDAALPTIKAAYRSLARINHPDLGGDQKVMVRLNEAWQTLRDADRRATYDREFGRPPERRSDRRGHRVLDFGRYQGWTLLEIAERDEDYLVWLGRTPIGRSLQAEINELLTARAAAMAERHPAAAKPNGRSWLHR